MFLCKLIVFYLFHFTRPYLGRVLGAKANMEPRNIEHILKERNQQDWNPKNITGQQDQNPLENGVKYFNYTNVGENI